MKPSEQEPVLQSATSDCYLESYTLTTIGSDKQHNEDSTLDLSEYGIFCVADGMGGSNAGKTASEYVTEAIKQQCWDTSFDNEQALIATVKEAISRSRIRIQRFAASNNLEGVGSTVAMLHLNPMKGSAFVLHAGDTRVYRLRDRTLTQLTQDHTVTGDLGLADGEDISHIIQEKLTRAVGLFDRVNLEVQSIDLLPNDMFLVCSSSLHRLLSDSAMTDILNKHRGEGAESVAKKLMEETGTQPSKEDISLVLVEVVSEMGVAAPAPRKPYLIMFSVAAVFVILFVGIFYFGGASKNKAMEAENQQEIVQTPKGTESETEPLTKEVAIDRTAKENEPLESNNPPDLLENASPSAHLENETEIHDGAPQAKPSLVENVLPSPGAQTSRNSSDSNADPDDQAERLTYPDETKVEIDSDRGSPDWDKSELKETELDAGSKTNNSTNDSDIGVASSSELADMNKTSVQPESAAQPIIISNPEVGSTRMLVEVYNDGTVETSKLSDQNYPAVSEDLAQHDSETSTNIEQQIDSTKESPPDSERSLNNDEFDLSKQGNIASIPKKEARTAATPKQAQQELQMPEPDQEAKPELSQDALDMDEIEGLLQELIDISAEWDSLEDEEKSELTTFFLPKIRSAIDDIVTADYANGSTLWQIFQQVGSIKEVGIQIELNDILLEYEADFAKYLTLVTGEARKTCDWVQVNRLLRQNHELCRELENLAVVKLAQSWSRLTTEGEEESQYVQRYMTRLIKLSSRLQPVIDLSYAADFESTDIANSKSLSPFERCQWVVSFNDHLHSKISKATEKLRTNLGIIDIGSVERLIEFTYPGGMHPKSYDKKIKFSSTGLAMLNGLENALAAGAEMESLDDQVVKLEENVKKVLVLFYRTQHHLRFIKEILDEQKQVAKQTGKIFLKDFTLPDYYAAKYDKINGIFSTDLAVELKERLLRSIVPDTE